MRPGSSTTGHEAVDAGGEHSPPAPRWPEIATALVMLAVTGSVFLLANLIGLRLEQPGLTPRSWPAFLGALGFGLSLILLITALVKRPSHNDDIEAATHSGWIKLLLALAATIAFIIVWPLTDFVIAAPVFVAVVTAIGGGRGIRALVIYPVVMTAALYAMFNLLLRVPL
jgi:putative tricarboxylic transport membrane protein